MRHIRDDLYAAMGTGFTVIPVLDEKEIKSLQKHVQGRAILAVLSARRSGVQLVFHEVLKILGVDHKGIYAHTFRAALAYIKQSGRPTLTVIESYAGHFVRQSDLPTAVAQIKRRLEWEERRRKYINNWKPEELDVFGVEYLNPKTNHVVQRRHHVNSEHRV